MPEPIGREAYCPKCGETFNPAADSDRIHYIKEDGTECGGTGKLLGEWRPNAGSKN